MRSVLLGLSILAAGLLTVGCSDHSSSTAAGTTTSAAAAPGGNSSADPALTTNAVPKDTDLTVQAGTGTEKFPVPGVAISVTSCSTNAEVANQTTDTTGAVNVHVAAGCYKATVKSVPTGCSPDAVADAKTDVKEGTKATLNFLIHCA
ncbi:MAG: hypothetical protein J2P18_01620 [Nocardia sp.]|nr:hypothetical protein [Nocardia sp.]